MRSRTKSESGLLIGFAVATLVTIGCGAGTKGGDRPVSNESSVNPPRVAVAVRDSLDHLIAALATLRGEFRHAPPYGGWEFRGNQRLFAALAQFGDSAVQKLVACLDDTTKSNVSVEGRPVLLGAVCYEALHHVAYVETPASELPWVGDISPTATPDALRRGKGAWMEAVRTHSYILL